MAAFLIDASLPRATAALVRSLAHSAVDVRDVGLGAAANNVIAEYARVQHLCLLTRDRDFANILIYEPHRYYGIAVICPPPNATRDVVLGLLHRFLQQPEIVARLGGRLVVIEAHRVRLRPP